MTDRIERELALPASPAEVWDAVTDPRRIAEWLAEDVALDLRPGGEAEFRFGDAVKSGWIEEVLPPDADGSDVRGGRLAFWWAQADEEASRVELSLTPVASGGTLLRVIETRPLEVLDLVGMPLPRSGGTMHGPALAAAA